MHREYWEAGYKVFGLWPVRDGQCACGTVDCPSIYKHPSITKWQKVPVWSNDQLNVMEDIGQFDTGFGVLVDGFLVVDVDPRNGGFDSYHKICADIGVDLINQCGFYVLTGGGGWHIYYKLSDQTALKGKLTQYPGIDFKSSGFVVGYGSQHASGHSYEIGKGFLEDINSPPDPLVALLRRPDHYRTQHNGSPIETSIVEIREMISVIDPDVEYPTWISVGMSIHEITEASSDGFDAWDQWSRKGKKYPGSDKLDEKWHGFGKSIDRVSYGTLKHIAQQSGYIEPVTFDYKPMGKDSQAQSQIDVSHIDICRPPGFVGEIASWINSQCRYPREKLAAMAALSVIANISKTRHIDLNYHVTPNLFVFCVAGSATGKEAIIQSISELITVASADHRIIGTIKSEQEIIRSLLHSRHCFYLMDEIGFFLRKLSNAQNKGGASYLEGVIALLMSAYSKANAKLHLGHDVTQDAIKGLKSEIAALNQAAEENENYDQAKLESALESLADLEQGFISKPFVSLVGFTTPSTFLESVNGENATNGFIGRSLIIEEKDTNPKIKPGFKPGTKMANGMKMRLAALAYAESEIQTTAAAESLLSAAQDHLHQIAEQQKTNSLEAIPRRGFELALKISLICAIPDGIRDVHHVEYALALVLHDIQHKIHLAASSMAEQFKDRNEEIHRRIMAQVESKEGLSIGVLTNRLRKFNRDDVLKAVKNLTNSGLIRQETSGKIKGRQTIYLFSVDQRGAIH